MSEEMAGGHGGGAMAMEMEGAGEGQEEVESSFIKAQEAAKRSAGADGECDSDGMHLIIPEDYPDEMTMIARGAGYECFASRESITVVSCSTAAIVFEASAESTVLAGRLAVGEDGDGHLVLKIAPKEGSKKCKFTASSYSKGEFGALRDATVEEAGGVEEEWAAPSSPSCVGLGEPVEFAQGGILRKGSRVCVTTKDGDELEGTVVMYNLTTGAYNVRLDTGELERDVARSSISKVTLEAGRILRCWFAGCRGRLADGHQHEKGYSTRSVSITDKTRAGNRDWARMRGWTLCFTCYVRFIQYGTLIVGESGSALASEADGDGKRKADDLMPLAGNEGKKQVKLPPTFTEGESCANCGSTHGRCRRVASSARAGNRDWSAYHDKCLCNACYVKYATTGTMKRPGTGANENSRGGRQDRTDSNRSSGTLPSPPAATRRRRASKGDKGSGALDDGGSGSRAGVEGGPEQPNVGPDAREDVGISETQQSQQRTEIEGTADEARRRQEQQQQVQLMQQQQQQQQQRQQQPLQQQQQQQDVEQQQQWFMQQQHNQQLQHQHQLLLQQQPPLQQQQQQPQQLVGNNDQMQERVVDERLVTVHVPAGAVAGGTFIVDFQGKRFSVPVSNTMFVGQAVTIKVDMNAVA